MALTARTMDPDPKYVGSLTETVGAIRGSGGNAVAIQADISSSEERERLFSEVVEQVGAPDILVNNAAVTFLRSLDEFPERRVKVMFEMHVFAPLHLVQLVRPGMRERKQGWICNMTSIAATQPAGPPFSDFDTEAGTRRDVDPAVGPDRDRRPQQALAERVFGHVELEERLLGRRRLRRVG